MANERHRGQSGSGQLPPRRVAARDDWAAYSLRRRFALSNLRRAGNLIWVLAVFVLASCGGGGKPAPDLFSLPVTYPIGKKASAIAAHDMNGDAFPDLVVISSQDNALHYFEGVGDGTFKTPFVLKTGREPIALAAADFNGDDIPDIAVANYGDGNVSVILGQKDGVFKLKEPVTVGRLPTALAAGDFNNDEKTDLAVALRFDKLVVLLGTGDGTFKVGEAYNASGAPSSVVAGDYDGDKNIDLAVAFGAVEADYIRVFPGKGDGTFKNPERIPGGHQSSFIAQHDMNGDRALDLFASSSVRDSVTLFLNDGKGKFQKMPDAAGEKGPEFVVAGEFTGDRIPDLVVCNQDDGSISMLEGRGDGTFVFPHNNYPVGRHPRAMTSADFNRDGLLDLALVLYDEGLMEILMRKSGASSPAEG
ncbi:MAG: VCBS repeat-containing protein [Nitrospinae bacterium]|nr:VCBS repeat-containing protein [Nitrospinota bacterium]